MPTKEPDVNKNLVFDLGFNTGDVEHLCVTPGMYKSRCVNTWIEGGSGGDKTILVKHQIIDDGPFKGKFLFDRFNLGHFMGKHNLSQFMLVTAGEHVTRYEAAKVLDKVFYAEVVNTKDKDRGRTYANIATDGYHTVDEVDGAGATTSTDVRTTPAFDDEPAANAAAPKVEEKKEETEPNFN